MKKQLLVLLTIPMLLGCAKKESIKDKFKDAAYIGELSFAKCQTIILEDNPGYEGETNYFKVTLVDQFVFNPDKYSGFTIVAYDTQAHYESYSFHAEYHVYDANFKEYNGIDFNGYLEYTGDEKIPGENAGIASYTVNQTIEAGDYYFSITPREPVMNATYKFWVTWCIGD